MNRILLSRLCCFAIDVLAQVEGAGGGARALYAWGYGDMCQLGNGEEKDEHFPYKVEGGAAAGGRGCVWAAGGGQHSTVVLS